MSSLPARVLPLPLLRVWLARRKEENRYIAQPLRMRSKETYTTINMGQFRAPSRAILFGVDKYARGYPYPANGQNLPIRSQNISQKRDPRKNISYLSKRMLSHAVAFVLLFLDSLPDCVFFFRFWLL